MVTNEESPRTYRVQARSREPLIEFMVGALEGSGCKILHCPKPDIAPFRLTFETSDGERLGIMAYAFLANAKHTKNRPLDEHRFHVKYGPDDGEYHRIWQDPFGLYTTIFLGINPELGFFVGADPFLHDPTRFYISIEFKQKHVDAIFRAGWHVWERERRVRNMDNTPVEVLVGGSRESFLKFVRFERESLREDQGHRHLLAEKLGTNFGVRAFSISPIEAPSELRLHDLAREFELDEQEVLNLIASARRLKMAVRGWVAEEHLVRLLRKVPGVTHCLRSDEEGAADVALSFRGAGPIRVECKNVLRERTASGLARLDFQRTRASKADPCSRYYSPNDFEVVAACMHAVTERWEFRFAPTFALDPHPTCRGKLSHRVRLEDLWTACPEEVLRAVVDR